MATTIKTVVELEKLGLYDELIKAYIAEKDAVKLQTVAFDEDTNTINFYTIGQPVGETAPAFSVELPETDMSGLISKIENATAGNVVIANADGTVADGGVALADLAKTADVTKAIEDAKYDDTQIKADIQANTDAITKLNGDATTDGSVAKAVKDSADAINATIGTVEEGKTVVGMIQDVKDAAYDDTEVRGLISDNADAISALDGEVGDLTTLKTTEKTTVVGAINEVVDGKADKATTIAGYGITDAFTKDEVTSAITTAVANADHLKRSIVDALPEVAEADANTIYMVAIEDGSGNQKYEEFMLINDAFEKIGDSAVDLTDYATKTEVATSKQEAIDAAATDATTKANTAESNAKAYTDEKIEAIDLSGIQTNADNIAALQETVDAIQYATTEDIEALFQ